MKLGESLNGRLYATSGQTVLREVDELTFEPLGTLTNPASGIEKVRFEFTNGRIPKRLLKTIVGHFPTTNVWPIESNRFLANVGKWLYLSEDRGRTWSVSHQLPPSSSRLGLLPSAVTRHNESLFIGEYPQSDDETARILRSDDGGHSWETELSLPSVRHVHSLTHDPYSGNLWVTTGDRDEECIIGRLIDGELEVIGTGDQQWRAVEPAFTPDAVLWGMDCSYADTVELLKLDRNEGVIRSAEPEVVGTTDSSVYYSETIQVDGEIWVVFATGKETGIDSTAPLGKRRNTSGPRARVIATSSDTGYTEWRELCSFEKRTVASDGIERLPNASSYVFLESDPDRGLFVNPYNTRRADGEILHVCPDRFREL